MNLTITQATLDAALDAIDAQIEFESLCGYERNDDGALAAARAALGRIRLAPHDGPRTITIVADDEDEDGPDELAHATHAGIAGGWSEDGAQ